MSKREATDSDFDPPLAKKSKMSGGVANGKDVDMDAAAVVVDEDLHSRQLAVYGREVMKRMAASSILVSGMNGLGVEIAKNVILASVRAVTVHDKKSVELVDLGAQFYLSEQDIGKNRAEACREKLQELNGAVAVSASQADLTQDFIKQFQVVVCTTASQAEALRIDQICHASGVRFIWAQTAGVFARVFTDFGQDFSVIDVNGEEPHQGIVASITGTTSPVVTCVEDERLEFQDGEFVTFSEVVGMDKLNVHAPIRIKNCKPHSFELELDVSEMGAYQRGGIVVQVKEHKTLNFKPLQQALETPGELMLSDYSKFDRPALLHVGFKALDAFEAEAGRKPRPADAADAARVIELAKQLNEQQADKAELNDDILRLLAHNASAEINPMAAMFGGVVGQEVLKAVSGKFHPIHQWFYFDSVESLPSEALPAEEYAPLGSRYDHQIAVFGRTLQAKLASLNLFLVGAGALGCEFLKNFALMGIACGAGAGGDAAKARVTVTDDDVIEKSNLSRQFLFRDWNIGGSKSTVAAEAARVLNPHFIVNPLQNRVSPETENVFNDSFWEGLDLVVNALDNVNARLYVDSRCVYFCKPLLESGTLGPKCNTQMVIPRMTENYGASRDPPEKQAPMCTVHSFPHNIDHCLTWARSEFEGLLEKAPSEANAFLADPDKYTEGVRANPDASARQKLEGIVELLVDKKPSTFEDCIAWARLRFQEYYHDRILQLTYTFPEDAVTSTGAPFWSAPKRFPRPVVFDAADPSHASFMQAGAILKAQVHNIPTPDWAKDMAAVGKAAAAVSVPAFEPKKGVKIETDPKKTADSAATMGVDDDAVIEELLGKLAQFTTASKPAQLAHVQFEKDDDTNFHMDLITGLANMRARNYAVQEVDKLKAKLIAGRIIPAIATATAVATGLVCLDLYKVIQGKPIEAYRNTFANLALPLFAMAEPVPAKTVTFKDISFSLWDRWILQGDLTVQELLDWFSEKGLTAYSISCGSALLYNNIFPKHATRLGQKVSELVGTVAKMEIPADRNHFDIVVACEDDDGNDLDVPLVSIKFR